MKQIDLENWPRRSHYEHFRGIANPHFGITAPVDVTPVMEVMKRNGLPVFDVVLFALMQAANEVAEFRTRFRSETVVEHCLVHASFTVPITADGFAFCEVETVPDFAAFSACCRQAIDKAKNQDVLVDKIAGQDNWIYLSCLPWINFTAMTNPFDGPDDCIPRITWGKITHNHGSWHMPVGVEAHHALLDAIHINHFYRNLEHMLGDVKRFL